MDENGMKPAGKGMHAGWELTEAPACCTEKETPAIVMVPERLAPVLAATWMESVPFPVPLAAPMMVTQLKVLEEFQEHPAPAVMAMVALPPAAERDNSVGLIE